VPDRPDPGGGAHGLQHTGGLSEAEQIQREWPLPDVLVLSRSRDATRRPNASSTLPIVLALGAAKRVRVVTSLWHLCAPYFFAPYPDSGLELGMRRARPLRGWPHLPAEEVGGLAGMARQRRNAMAAVRLPEDQETAAP
jgi:hypothetical protein